MTPQIWRGARRYHRRLADTAGRLVAAGWPIVPGSWWSVQEGRHRCDLAGCLTASVHPAPIPCHEGAFCAGGWPDLTRYAIITTEQVRTRWAFRPYSILVVTGVVVDAIEAPASIADQAIHHLHMTGRPVLAARVNGRVLVFLAAGPPVDPDRALTWSTHRVLFHQRGSWVVLPPSTVDGQRTNWLRKPKSKGPLPLPPADAVLPLLDQLGPPPPRPARGVVPMPTVRLRPTDRRPPRVMTRIPAPSERTTHRAH